MARRASSRISLPVILGSAFLLLLLLGGGYWFLSGTGNPFRGLQPFDSAAYLENANSLRGNDYRVEGVVQNSLAWSASKGRLISVSIASGDSGGNGGTKGDIIAILIPATLNHINLQKGQRYQFSVEIDKDGIILARDLRKS